MPFIRRGAWCECGRSCNVRTKQLEQALSAYECEPGGERRWRAKGAAWEKEARSLGKAPGPWFLIGGYPVPDQLGGDREPLLRQAWLITGLEFRDRAGDLFDETATRAAAIENHPGFMKGECVCQSSVEFFHEEEARAVVDPDELFENAAGADVPWRDLSPDEQRYYRDEDVDMREVSVSEYVRKARERSP